MSTVSMISTQRTAQRHPVALLEAMLIESQLAQGVSFSKTNFGAYYNTMYIFTFFEASHYHSTPAFKVQADHTAKLLALRRLYNGAETVQ